MKTKIIIVTLIAFAFNFNLNSQNFTLPQGYQTFKDYDGKEQRVDGDFDRDGLNDTAIVCSAKDGENNVVVYLASKWIVDQSYYSFPWASEMNYLEFKNNILSINSNDCAGRCFKTLKFKYYSDLANMKLIGYEEGYLGNANHEGAYEKSINLNTGEYEISGKKRKITIDLITLSNIEKYFDYLSSLGLNYIGK